MRPRKRRYHSKWRYHRKKTPPKKVSQSKVGLPKDDSVQNDDNATHDMDIFSKTMNLTACMDPSSGASEVFSFGISVWGVSEYSRCSKREKSFAGYGMFISDGGAPTLPRRKPLVAFLAYWEWEIALSDPGGETFRHVDSGVSL